MKVVLAYSGGLDTSIILHWIKEHYNAEVIAYTADVGQGGEVEAARQRAMETGASEVVIEDLRREFVEDCIFPALRANAVYEWYYLMGTALARPVIARGMVRAANRFGAEAIGHGATGKGNDQVRFEMAAYALKPDLKIIAPWREWDLKGRTDLLAYAKAHGIDLGSSSEKPDYSMDANLMHISYEGGVLEDPWAAPPLDMFRMTTNPEDAPDKPEYVTIRFEQGNPVAVNDELLDPVELVEKVNEIAGRHGVGRVDIVENRYLGMKSRGVYETPGVTLLLHGHRAVESITLDREVQHLRDELTPRFAEIIYNGLWFSPEREALQSFMDSVQERVSGEARLKLYKGSVWVEGRRSPKSLYDEKIATFEADDVFEQSDATGFIRLNSLRLRSFGAKRISEGE